MAGTLYVPIAVVGLVCGPLIALSSSPPVTGELMLIVGPDAAHREQLVREAGGRVVGPSQASFGSFAVSELPGFAETLKSAPGVWFLVDGRQIARLCGVEV